MAAKRRRGKLLRGSGGCGALARLLASVYPVGMHTGRQPFAACLPRWPRRCGTVLLGAMLALALTLPATRAQAQTKPDKACSSVVLGEGLPVAQARAYEDLYDADPANPLPLWQAATVLRCTLANSVAPAAQCLQAGDAKSLYDKFADVTASLGASKAYKAQLADTNKQGKKLTTDFAVSCAALARETLKQGQSGPAALLYEAVYVLTYKPNLLYNAARACEMGALWMQAAVYFTAYLALPAPWRDRKDAVQKLVEIQQRLASDTGGQVRLAIDAASRATTLAERGERMAQAAQKLAQDTASKADQALARAGNAETRSARAEQQALEARQQALRAEETARTADTRGAWAQNRATEHKTRLDALERTVQEMLAREAQRAPPPGEWKPRASYLPGQALAPAPAE